MFQNFSLNIRTYMKSHPFLNAVLSGNIYEIESGLIWGEDPNGIVMDWGTESILNLACSLGQGEVVRMLLRYGAKINYQSGYKYYTALHRACMGKHPHLVKLLIEEGANIHLNDFESRSPLIKSISCIDCCRILLQAGAELNVPCGLFFSSTPLIEACKQRRGDVVRFLIDSRADVNLKGATTPLNKAVYSPDILSILLEQNPDLNCRSKESNFEDFQPLHEAAYAGVFLSVELLLCAGADKNAKVRCFSRHNNDTALQLAQKGLERTKQMEHESIEIQDQHIREFQKIIHLLTDKEDCIDR
jgi:ankyrin repeat protein